MSRMADRNVSKSARGSLSPDVFRSHPPSFEAAGQQHSGIAGARQRTRPRAHIRARASPHPHALRPSCRRHDALGRRPTATRPAPSPALGPLDRAPGRDWPPICTGGSRPKRDASAENGTLAEFSWVSQYPCRTPGGDRAVAGLFSVGPPGDGYPMATLLPIARVPGCSAHAPAHAPIRARAVNRAEDCLCFKQNLLKSVKRS